MENQVAATTDDDINPNGNPDGENLDTRYWRESHHLLTLFPSVVWDHICSFLDSQDFLNLNNSSLFFRELFLQKRVLFLYKPVLELLLPRLKKESKAVSTWRNQDRTVDKLLLNSRAVCKSWKWTIDKKACLWIPGDKTGENNYVHCVLVGQNRFIQCQKFLQHFTPTHPPSVNPFIGRAVCLKVDLGKPEFPQISKQISTLLERYGEHLWTCDFRLNFANLNPSEFRYNFVQWLNYMPNLQNLSIYAIFRVGSNIPLCQLELVPNKLINLKKLSIVTNCLSRLDEDLPEWSWLERFNFNHLITNQENLEYFQVFIFNQLDLGILEQFNSPLKSLTVQCLSREGDLRIAEMFTLLSDKFSGTLEKLSVLFRKTVEPSKDIQVIRDTFNGRLNLPKVKIFEINIENVICLDFLLGMKDSLEKLIISGEGAENNRFDDYSEEEKEEIGGMAGNQIVEYLGYHNKIMESNIWEIFPKLNKIVLKRERTTVECFRGDIITVRNLW